MVSAAKYRIAKELDVPAKMRDGTTLFADIYRPDSEGKFPVLLLRLPYGKQFISDFGDHEFFVPRGYIVVIQDTRGRFSSEGDFTPLFDEPLDGYDTVEWAAKLPWSNGKVGLVGVSYYAITQWNVSSLQPPSLTTIVPWEGWADMYRDSVFHGGIFNQGFYGRWWLDVRGKQLLENTRADNSAALSEDLIYNFMAHHLDSPWWDEVKSRAQFDKITVPLYSSGNWGGWNHHMRGNVDGYVRSASIYKKLEMHIGGHTDAFYSDEGKHEMLRWYDYWLKDKDTGIMDEPPVKLCIRTSVRECEWRFENEWPLARTQYRRYYLNPEAAGVVQGAVHDAMLTATPPSGEGQLTYPTGPEAYSRGLAGQPTLTFVTEPMSEDVEITGHSNLVMWVSSETDDMDIFAYLRNMAPDGTVETSTRGILRVALRKLNPDLSTPYRPYHSHDEEQKLTPGEIVPVQVEIWATSMVFKAGHRIRLDVQPHDGQHYFAAYALGNNTIYTGGDRASYILLPFVPAK